MKKCNKKEDIHSWEEHLGFYCGEKGNYKVIDCQKCGFKHIIPIPTDKELEEFYSKKYFAETDLQYVLDKDSVWLECIYKDVLEKFAMHTKIKNDKKRFLEIGTGHAFFLKVAKSCGWEVLGIDPCQDSKIFADKWNVDFISGMWNKEIAKKVGKFSAIYFSEVLEHVANPFEFLNLTKDALVDGGVVCIMLPNEFNPLQDVVQKIYEKDKWYIVPPEHINYFNHQSLSLLLEKIGFEIIELSSTFPMEFFLIMGNDYIGKGEGGKPFHENRMKFDIELIKHNKEIRWKLYNAFASLGIGREVVIFAKKNGKQG